MQERRSVAALKSIKSLWSSGDAAAGSGPGRWILLGGVAVAAVVADRVTESVAVSKLAGHPVHVVGPLWLKLSYNTGAAFGVAQGWSTELAVIAVALIAVLIFVGRSTSKNLGLVAVGLMLGGAIGNLSDRLFGNASGAVVDFIYTRFWPTFNVADACIVIGGALLVITMGRSKKTH